MAAWPVWHLKTEHLAVPVDGTNDDHDHDRDHDHDDHNNDHNHDDNDHNDDDHSTGKGCVEASFAGFTHRRMQT